MNPKRLFLSPPHMGGQELSYIHQAFESNYIAPLGEHVDAFEKELCEATGVAHAAVLSTGTAAIHLALVLLGVSRDDLVICQSFTFAGTINPVSYQGAIPVLIDSEPDTWNMDPQLLRKAISDALARGIKPKAIIPVHLYGMPARMPEIMAIAKEFAIPVIEDAAEALGSSVNGKPCGGLGDMGILSFNGNKIITTSGGGALLSNDSGLVSRARFLSTQARDPAPHYEHTHIGYNYRMSNILAAIGRGQMQVLEKRVMTRRQIYAYYVKKLGHTPGISFLPEPEGFYSNRWLTTMLVDPAQTGGVTHEDVRLGLEKENIESRPLWKPMHLQPVFASAPMYENGNSRILFEKGLCLPSGTQMGKNELERVVGVVKGVLAARRGFCA